MLSLTRSQKDMGDAAGRVAQVRREPWAKTYGSLCHSFPVMVRTCGLCQAVAFSAAKAAKEPAHRRVLEDVRAILGIDPATVATVGCTDYMLHTRRLLAAWIYYKRFAVSILGVERPEEDGDE